MRGTRGDGERGGQASAGRSARTLGCRPPTPTPPGMKYCTRGGEGERGAGGKPGCGDPLLVPALPTEPPGGGGGPCRPPQGFLVRKTEGGVGVPAPTNTPFPGNLGRVCGCLLRSQGELGAFLGLLVGMCGPQSTSRAWPRGQGRPQERDEVTRPTGAGLLLRPGVPTSVAWSERPAPPHHRPCPAARGKAGTPPPGRGRQRDQSDLEYSGTEIKHRRLIQHLERFVHFCFVETEVRYTCPWPHGGRGARLYFPLQRGPPHALPRRWESRVASI